MARTLYLAMKVQPPSSIEVTSLFGKPVPISCDMSGLVGFVLAFDNVEQAKEWGDGEYMVVRTLEREEVKSGA